MDGLSLLFIIIGVIAFIVAGSGLFKNKRDSTTGGSDV